MMNNGLRFKFNLSRNVLVKWGGRKGREALNLFRRVDHILNYFLKIYICLFCLFKQPFFERAERYKQKLYYNIYIILYYIINKKLEKITFVLEINMA